MQVFSADLEFSLNPQMLVEQPNLKHSWPEGSPPFVSSLSLILLPHPQTDLIALVSFTDINKLLD